MIAATRTADAILPAVLPEAARRIAAGGDLALTLGEAGAEVVDPSSPEAGEADVALSSSGSVPAAGPRRAVVLIDSSDDGLDASSIGRMAVRVKDHLAVRAAVARSTRSLAARGYGSCFAVFYDRGQVAQLPGATFAARPRPAERLPRRAAAVGDRHASDGGRTIFESALAEAGLGDERLHHPLVRSGTLVALGDEAVLRTAVGPACSRLDRAAGALRSLQSTFPRPDLLPSIIATGRSGLGAWTAERRLEGRPLIVDGHGALSAAMVEIAAALFVSAPGPSTPLPTLAASLAERLGPARGRRISELAGRFGEVLGGIPGGMVHGDLWRGNVLERDGRITGLIDWDSAGPSRLPFIDLIHFRVAARVPRGSQQWGRQVVEEMEDLDGPDGRMLERYGRAVDVSLDRSLRRALVVGYWLDRLVFQATTYADRVHRPRWLEWNVDLVISALSREAP